MIDVLLFVNSTTIPVFSGVVPMMSPSINRRGYHGDMMETSWGYLCIYPGRLIPHPTLGSPEDLGVANSWTINQSDVEVKEAGCAKCIESQGPLPPLRLPWTQMRWKQA